MDVDIRKLLSSAKQDELFLTELQDYDPGNRNAKPDWLSGDGYNHFFATCYYGWYLGKYGAEQMKIAFP